MPGVVKPLNLGEAPLPPLPPGVLGPGHGGARAAHLAHIELTDPQLSALLVIGVGRGVEATDALAALLGRTHECLQGPPGVGGSPGGRGLLIV